LVLNEINENYCLDDFLDYIDDLKEVTELKVEYDRLADLKKVHALRTFIV
jgi:hypothetical protein